MKDSQFWTFVFSLSCELFFFADENDYLIGLFFPGKTVYFCISVIFSASLIKMYRLSKKFGFGGSLVENGCSQVLIDYTSIDFGSSRLNTQLIDRSLILTVLWFWSSSVFAKCFRGFLITRLWLGKNYSSTIWFISQQWWFLFYFWNIFLDRSGIFSPKWKIKLKYIDPNLRSSKRFEINWKKSSKIL